MDILEHLHGRQMYYSEGELTVIVHTKLQISYCALKISFLPRRW
jgi:hypothetical protein